MNNKVIFLVVLSFLMAGCRNEVQNNELSEKKIDKRSLPTVDINKINEDLTDIAHKTVCKFKDDTLSIDLYIKNEDFSSKYYTDILIELVICDISNHIYPNHTVKIIQCFENGTRNSPEIIDNSMILKIIAVNKIKTYYDFKKYTIKNVRGEKLTKLNFIIDNLIKNRKSKKPNPLKENDFIQVVLSYATHYCLPEKKDDFYLKLLQAIKEVANDKEIWPDFNPQDVDYFLDYCDTSTHV